MILIHTTCRSHCRHRPNGFLVYVHSTQRAISLPPLLHITGGIGFFRFPIPAHGTDKSILLLHPGRAAPAAFLPDAFSQHFHHFGRMLSALLLQPLPDIPSLPLSQGMVDPLIRPSGLCPGQLRHIHNSRLFRRKETV